MSEWGNRVKLTIDSSDITAALSFFPVTVFINSSCGRNNGDLTPIFDEVGAESLKIAFTKDDGSTQLFAEIDKWDESAEQAIIHVSKTGWDISNVADTDFYIYFDSAQDDNSTYIGFPESTPAENVWDSDYLMRHPMTDDDTSNLHDSTVNDNDTAKLAANRPVEYSLGKVGKTQTFDGTDYAMTGNSPFSNADVASGTVEAWVRNTDVITPNDNYIIDCEGVIRPHKSTTHKLTAEVAGNSVSHGSAMADSTWYHFAQTWDSVTLKLYVDGTFSDSVASGSPLPDAFARPLSIGSSYLGTGQQWKGQIDELRVSGTDRTAAWINASYESQMDDLLDFDVTESLTPIEAELTNDGGRVIASRIVQNTIPSDLEFTSEPYEIGFLDSAGDEICRKRVFHQAEYQIVEDTEVDPDYSDYTNDLRDILLSTEIPAWQDDGVGSQLEDTDIYNMKLYNRGGTVIFETDSSEKLWAYRKDYLNPFDWRIYFYNDMVAQRTDEHYGTSPSRKPRALITEEGLIGSLFRLKNDLQIQPYGVPYDLIGIGLNNSPDGSSVIDISEGNSELTKECARLTSDIVATPPSKAIGKLSALFAHNKIPLSLNSASGKMNSHSNLPIKEIGVFNTNTTDDSMEIEVKEVTVTKVSQVGGVWVSGQIDIVDTEPEQFKILSVKINATSVADNLDDEIPFTDDYIIPDVSSTDRVGYWRVDTDCTITATTTSIRVTYIPLKIPHAFDLEDVYNIFSVSGNTAQVQGPFNVYISGNQEKIPEEDDNYTTPSLRELTTSGKLISSKKFLRSITPAEGEALIRVEAEESIKYTKKKVKEETSLLGFIPVTYKVTEYRDKVKNKSYPMLLLGYKIDRRKYIEKLTFQCNIQAKTNRNGGYKAWIYKKADRISDDTTAVDYVDHWELLSETGKVADESWVLTDDEINLDSDDRGDSLYLDEKEFIWILIHPYYKSDIDVNRWLHIGAGEDERRTEMADYKYQISLLNLDFANLKIDYSDIETEKYVTFRKGIDWKYYYGDDYAEWNRNSEEVIDGLSTIINSPNSAFRKMTHHYIVDDSPTQTVFYTRHRPVDIDSIKIENTTTEESSYSSDKVKDDGTITTGITISSVEYNTSWEYDETEMEQHLGGGAGGAGRITLNEAQGAAGGEDLYITYIYRVDPDIKMSFGRTGGKCFARMILDDNKEVNTKTLDFSPYADKFRPYIEIEVEQK